MDLSKLLTPNGKNWKINFKIIVLILYFFWAFAFLSSFLCENYISAVFWNSQRIKGFYGLLFFFLTSLLEYDCSTMVC